MLEDYVPTFTDIMQKPASKKAAVTEERKELDCVEWKKQLEKLYQTHSQNTSGVKSSMANALQKKMTQAKEEKQETRMSVGAGKPSDLGAGQAVMRNTVGGAGVSSTVGE